VTAQRSRFCQVAYGPAMALSSMQPFPLLGLSHQYFASIRPVFTACFFFFFFFRKSDFCQRQCRLSSFAKLIFFFSFRASPCCDKGGAFWDLTILRGHWAFWGGLPRQTHSDPRAHFSESARSSPYAPIQAKIFLSFRPGSLF